MIHFSIRTIFVLTLLVTLGAPLHAGGAGPFIQAPLPYAEDVLAPVMDAETMRLHYGHHHRGYVEKLNAKVAEFPDLAKLSLEDVQRRISSFDTAVRNNGGGHYNHALFWELMAPPGEGGAPDGELVARINRDFGTVEDFRKQFVDAALSLFGSGWAWLVVRDDGSLAITSTSNQDNPLMDVVPAEARGTPILALDVWEHAYYLKHRNKRAGYVADWWEVVNWREVAKRYARVADEARQERAR